MYLGYIYLSNGLNVDKKINTTDSTRKSKISLKKLFM